MSRRQYPRLGGSGILKERSGLKVDLCGACDAPATHYVEVQTSWFRGDDDVIGVCAEHRKMAQRDYPGHPPRPCFRDFYKLACETWTRRDAMKATK